MTALLPCPSVDTLLAQGNDALAAALLRRPVFGYTDTSVFESAFPEWTVLGSSDRDRTYGGKRILLRHQAHPWYLLAFTSAHRLLPSRETCTDEDFRFTTDRGTGPAYVVGTEETIIAHTADRFRRGGWSLDHLWWVFNLIPGERAEAEAMLLALEGAPHPTSCRCASCLAKRR
jgi:hypothetical protein